jgi:hypothetical protein
MTDYTRVSSKITLEGPFFTKDPGKTLRANVRDLMEALAEWGEAEVRNAITANAGSMPYYDGWSWAHTRGRVESVEGKQWGTWARVSAYTGDLDATDARKTKAAAATIERRWRPYRRVKSAVYRARPLLTADLTKGLE